MTHSALTNPGWYDAMMADDARLGPTYAEDLHFPYERPRAPGAIVRPDLTNGTGLAAFMDCLLEKRGYMLVTIPRAWREAVAEQRGAA